MTVGCAITTSRIDGWNAAERKRKKNRDDLDERLSLFFSRLFNMQTIPFQQVFHRCKIHVDCHIHEEIALDSWHTEN